MSDSTDSGQNHESCILGVHMENGLTLGLHAFLARRKHGPRSAFCHDLDKNPFFCRAHTGRRPTVRGSMSAFQMSTAYADEVSWNESGRASESDCFEHESESREHVF